MFKYRIQAYNTDPGVGVLDEVVLAVTAKNEQEAIKKAQEIKSRQSYVIIEIEDLNTGREIRKKG